MLRTRIVETEAEQKFPTQSQLETFGQRRVQYQWSKTRVAVPAGLNPQPPPSKSGTLSP
jgi:hypothetical protein